MEALFYPASSREKTQTLEVWYTDINLYFDHVLGLFKAEFLFAPKMEHCCLLLYQNHHYDYLNDEVYPNTFHG